jgi:hypothetical protein
MLNGVTKCCILRCCSAAALLLLQQLWHVAHDSTTASTNHHSKPAAVVSKAPGLHTMSLPLLVALHWLVLKCVLASRLCAVLLRGVSQCWFVLLLMLLLLLPWL